MFAVKECEYSKRLCRQLYKAEVVEEEEAEQQFASYIYSETQEVMEAKPSTKNI